MTAKPMPADCDEPVCHSKVDQFMKVLGKKPKEIPTNAACPLDREELGRSTWNLLHTMAAYYPETPNEQHRQHCDNFIRALAHLFPCRPCADDFRECLELSPPRVASKEALSIWLCEQHNFVNEKLGKTQFSCTMKDLDERWKTGAPGCFPSM